MEKIAIDGKNNSIEQELEKASLINNLQECFIKNAILSDKEIERINQFSSLEVVYFDNCIFRMKDSVLKFRVKRAFFCFCNKVDCNKFSKEQEIEELFIRQCRKVKIEGIEKLKTLKIVCLQYNKIQDLNPIRNLPNLKKLNLNGSKVENSIALEDIKNRTMIEWEKEDLPIG